MIALAATGCVVLAAVAVMWPAPGSRSRRRRLLAPARHRRPWRPEPQDLVAGWLAAGRPGQPYGWLLVALVVVLAVVVGGIVAGLVVAGYGLVAVRALTRQRAQRDRAQRRTDLLDSLAVAAADLRAGLPPGTALADLATTGTDPLLARVRAAVRLAERAGAPLADVLERIEADARSVDRARATSAAQAAGSRATAWLLAALPAGGIALGYAIGTDPLAVLLRTPVGAACALGAMALQLAGLAWAGRISRPMAAA